MRRVGLVNISSSSTSELGTIISTTSSESEDAFSFLEGDFSCLVVEEGVRKVEGPATRLNIGSTVGVVNSGLLFRFLGVPLSTEWSRPSKSFKINGLFGAWILAKWF